MSHRILNRFKFWNEKTPSGNSHEYRIDTPVGVAILKRNKRMLGFNNSPGISIYSMGGATIVIELSPMRPRDVWQLTIIPAWNHVPPEER